MNKCKVFGDYFLELLKLIVFGAALVWLCSCNNNRERAIELIHAYTDSIHITRREEAAAQTEINKLRDLYTQQYPIKRFTAQQAKERERWQQAEEVAYLRLTRACTEYDIKKIFAQTRRQEYMRKIDSLKLEIYR